MSITCSASEGRVNRSTNASGATAVHSDTSIRNFSLVRDGSDRCWFRCTYASSSRERKDRSATHVLVSVVRRGSRIPPTGRWPARSARLSCEELRCDAGGATTTYADRSTMTAATTTDVGVAVLGAGRWGCNLVHNLYELG